MLRGVPTMPFAVRAALVALFSLALRAHAAEAPDADAASTTLDRIVVTATLTARAQEDVASEVGVIEAQEIDRRQVQDLADLVRYEPGVSATGSAIGAGRFGAGGLSIRGLGGNRVRLELDGIAIPESFEIGSFSSAGRDVVDVDSLKRVEIVRGAASSLYGSDAIAGVVSFVSKDPSDYLGPAGGQHLGAKFLYDSASRASAQIATLAAADARHGFMLVATHREGHATNNRGEVDSADTTRTRPNPQDTRGNAVLAKYVHTNADGRIDRLSFDAVRDDVATDVLSSRGLSALTGTLTQSLEGDDSRDRLRFGFDQHLATANAFADTLDWNAYVQRSRTTQDTREQRATLGPEGPTAPKQRFRRFEFEQRVTGAEAIARKELRGGNVEHALTLGVELSRTRTFEQRDGWQRDLLTGEISNVVAPDVFPVRDFPLSDTTVAALFAQDEMTAAGGRLSLVPALRVDHYALDPREDAVFAEDNPHIEPASLRHTAGSPKFGAIWRFDPTWSLFAQYAHGFRAPPYSDVNVGFTNLAFGYTSLPNPGLEPETSDGLELGLRVNGRTGWASVAAYENRYRDFIESQAFVGVDPETGLMLFQSINIGRVRIRGVEARYGLDLGALAPALEGWSLEGSLANARGDDRVAREPLTSIDPARAVLGLRWERGDWQAELVGSAVARKDRLPAPAPSSNPASPPATPLFEAPGHATFDLYTRWQGLPSLQLFAALTNIGDRRYWNWGSVAGMPAAATIDRYSAPGRALRVGLRATF
jgi:hemoglobin/transferrin/lactoferrin receptor protein